MDPLQRLRVLMGDEPLITETAAPEQNVASLPKHDGRLQGEIGPQGEYCPIKAVAQLPYAFMKLGPDLTRMVSKEFFAGGRFWNEPWTLYYVHVSSTPYSKHLLFVPKYEVQSFIACIESEYSIGIELPNDPGFCVNFKTTDAPPLRFLGASTSENDYRVLECRVPEKSVDFEDIVGGDADKPVAEPSSAWQEDLMAAGAAVRKQKDKEKARKKAKRIHNRNKWVLQLRRIQCYLGLRDVSPSQTSPVSQNSALLGPSDVEHSEHTGIFEFNKKVPPSYLFDTDVVFLAVDVEVNEKNQTQVTEIGVAVLDTRELHGFAPGELGIEWQAKVRARHFWVDEYAHIINQTYIQGRPRDFERRFGVTECVPLTTAMGLLMNCFQDPTAAFGLKPNTSELSESFKSFGVAGQMGVAATNPRKIVLVGHNIGSDVRYLKKALGFELDQLPNVIEVVDTQLMYQTLMETDLAPSVGSMLFEFNVDAWATHNAGNDAAYTLQSLCAIAIKGMVPCAARLKSDEAQIGAGMKEKYQEARDGLDE